MKGKSKELGHLTYTPGNDLGPREDGEGFVRNASFPEALTLSYMTGLWFEFEMSQN